VLTLLKKTSLTVSNWYEPRMFVFFISKLFYSNQDCTAINMQSFRWTHWYNITVVHKLTFWCRSTTLWRFFIHESLDEVTNAAAFSKYFCCMSSACTAQHIFILQSQSLQILNVTYTFDSCIHYTTTACSINANLPCCRCDKTNKSINAWNRQWTKLTNTTITWS